jgi:parallel beta-helix repeat protein
MRPNSVLALAVVLAWPFAEAAPAASPPCTFHVRAGFVPGAGAPADGLTPQTAFSAIRLAAQALRNPGDVVCVGPGEYVEANITPRRSGIATHPIVFRADPSGQSTGDPPGDIRLTPPPAESDSTPAGFRLLGQRHVIIDGFTIEGFVDPAIQVRSAVGSPGNSTDVTIRNNRIVSTLRTAIDVSAEGLIVIEGNRVVGAGGSGISVQSCVHAPAFDDPDALLQPRCRGGPSELVQPIVANNRIGINASHGIFVQDARHGVIQNNMIYSNDATGITLRSAPDFLLVNNLVYRSGEQGLAVGTADLPAPRAVVVNNTFFDNGKWGIEVGSGNAASPGAMIVNNILHLNGGGEQGIGVRNESRLEPRSTCGYVSGFNVTQDAYGPGTPRNVYDTTADPLFVGPVSGPDGILGGHIVDGEIVDGSEDDNFTIRQPGSSRISPAVDAGYARVEEVGLFGSTAPDGKPDTGILDAGYHYGVPPGDIPTIPTPFMPLFVRAGGNNSGSGKTPAAAFATVGVAALRARAGVTVIVGPGTYRECQLRPPPDQGRAVFLADPQGLRTGDPPGHVLIDPGCCTTDPETYQCVPGLDGFNIPNSCFVVVDGFHVRGAADSGIIIQAGSHGAEVRNNITFSNERRGIGVINAHDARIVNNLVYDNAGGGIQIGGVCRGNECEGAGSRHAVIESNTCYGNGVNGILIGSGAGQSTYATVRHNVLHVGNGENRPPGENGVQVGSNTTFQNHLEGYAPSFNLNFEGRYGAGTPQPPSDRVDDPLFVDPAGPDGILGGEGFADDGFHLSQLAAGQSADSPAVDFADVTAVSARLDARSTRTDLMGDEGQLDLGFHYAIYRWTSAGDCDGDGHLSVSELVLAVRIALAELPMEACPNADANGDRKVTVDEVARAVRRALANP